MWRYEAVVVMSWWGVGLDFGDSDCRTHDFKGIAAGLDQVRPSGRRNVQKKFQKRSNPKWIPRSRIQNDTRKPAPVVAGRGL